jgi:hypothetical protein
MDIIEHIEFTDRQRFWAAWCLWCDNADVFALSIGAE